MFGLEFFRQPPVRKAELMAHVLIKKQRECYIESVTWEWQQEKAKREKSRKGGNPMEDWKRRQMVR